MMTTNQTLSSAPLPHGFVALVVDHDPASRLNLCGLIESEGGQAIEASNVTGALSAIRERRPDIVLLDATSSETGGFDACEQIRALPHGSDTPVLMMIAFDDDATVNLALAVGAADYVTKPIRPVVLRQRIRRLLQAHYTDVAILRAKKEWETAVDAVSDMVILTDLNGRIIRCNLATIQALQTTYSKLIGKNLETVLLKKSGQKLDLTFGEPHEMQFPSLPGWYEVRTFHGQLEGRWHTIVYILKSITERKQLEESMRQSEQRFKALVENITEGVELFDATGQVLYASPMVARILGVPSATALVGLNPMANIHPDDLERNLGLFTELVQKPGSSFTTEIRTKHADGSWIWAEASARNLLNEPGINAVLINFKDITERKQTQLKLSQLSQAVEQSPVSIVITDTDGKIEYINHQFTQLTGYTFEEVVGQNPRLLQSGQTPSEIYIEMWNAITAGHEWQGEFINRKKNGEIFVERASLAPVVDEQGKITHFLALKEDITDHKRAEEILRVSEANLSEALQIAKLAYWEYDVPNDVFSFNDQFYSIFHTTASQEGGYGMSSALYAEKFCYPDDKGVVATEIQKALSSTDREYRTQLDHRILYADGGVGYVSVRINVDRDEQGHILRFYGANQDISERKQAEEALHASEARYRSLFEDSPVALWEEDFSEVKIFFDRLRVEEGVTDFRVFFEAHPEAVSECAARVIVRDVNKAAMRLLGAERKEQLLGALNAIVSPETSSAFREELISIAGGCTHYTFEGPNLALNGETRHVNVIWSVWPGYENTLSKVTVSVIDLTERKQAEEALRLSEERFKMVTHATNDAVWDLDLSTNDLWWNRGVSSLFGYSSDQVSKTDDWWEDRLHPDDRSKVLDSFQKALTGDGQFWSKEYRFRRADGTYAYVFDRAYIMTDEHGIPVRAIGAMMDITDRKQSENSLRVREQQLEEAQHTAHLGSWEWDFNTKETFWSDELYRLCGWSPRSITPTQEAFLSLVHPDDRERAMQIVGQTFQTRQPYDFDYRIISAQGELRWLHGHGEFLQDETGQPLRFRGTAQDITARKQAEEALRASQAELSEALQIAKLAYWEYDVPNDLFIFNDHFYSIFHTTAAAEGGYTMSAARYTQKFCHPDDVAVVGTEIERALNSTDQHYRAQLDHRILYADGGVGYISVRVNIQRDEKGQILHYYGANQDITERKHMEAALMESEELFSKAFHASPAPMGITRLEDGTMIDVNGSWERLLGYERESVIGVPILDLNIYANPYERAAILQQVREQGKIIDHELRVNTESGEELDLLMSAQIVEIQGQDCLMSTFYDITDLKRMHEAMLASQKLADLGTLAAGVAHEMNSPLQVITGVSQSLLRKTDNGVVEPEQLRRNLDVIHRNGWRCAEIVRSLHTYARNSGGSMEPAGLNELVSDALLLIEHQLKSWANISVHTFLAEELPPLTCDRNQITQVLINLLTNARDAMPDGGEITIATGHDPRSDLLMLQVSDAGIGIPDSIRSKIFDPFFTTKPLGKGTGLGLSIVDGIVRAHGGTIEVHAALPQGTTFTAHFPAKPPKLPASNAVNVPGRFNDIVDACTTAEQLFDKGIPS